MQRNKPRSKKMMTGCNGNSNSLGRKADRVRQPEVRRDMNFSEEQWGIFVAHSVKERE